MYSKRWFSTYGGARKVDNIAAIRDLFNENERIKQHNMEQNIFIAIVI